MLFFLRSLRPSAASCPTPDLASRSRIQLGFLLSLPASSPWPVTLVNGFKLLPARNDGLDGAERGESAGSAAGDLRDLVDGTPPRSVENDAVRTGGRRSLSCPVVAGSAFARREAILGGGCFADDDGTRGGDRGRDGVGEVRDNRSSADSFAGVAGRGEHAIDSVYDEASEVHSDGVDSTDEAADDHDDSPPSEYSDLRDKAKYDGSV